MWLLRTTLVGVCLAITLPAQTAFSTINEPNVRAEAVRAARNRLAGRSDSAALKQWDSILAEMHLAHDPDLKGVVQILRGMNLYGNESWINLVGMGYAYLGDTESARQFRADLASRLPDSSWAIQDAIKQWESAHPVRDTSQAGFIEWHGEQLAFLKRLHETKPFSEVATREYLQKALSYEPHLSTEQALAVATLLLHNEPVLAFDPYFHVAELYLGRHARLDEVPGLLNNAVRKVERQNRESLNLAGGAEAANRQIVQAQLRAHRNLAEYWLQKNNTKQARIATLQARADLARLAPGPEVPRRQRESFDTEQKLWSNLAKRAGVDDGLLLQEQQVDWANVARVPLDDFEAIDLTGRRWTLKDWKGRVVLVNMWATWCTPCRRELPSIQELHQAFKGRQDRLVISINVDSDPDLARRLMHEQGYTFPVLRSNRLADNIDFINGVPQNRIIDAQGRLLVESINGSGDAWVGRVKGLMGQVK